MTDVESNKIWAGFKKYAKNIVEVRMLSSPVWDLIRPFTKWFFDVIKNVTVVVALQYLGQKTGSKSIQTIGSFSAILLTVYFISYVNMWMPNFFNVKNKHIAIEIFGGVLTIAIMLGLMYGGNWLITNLMTELTNAQGK